MSKFATIMMVVLSLIAGAFLVYTASKIVSKTTSVIERGLNALDQINP